MVDARAKVFAQLQVHNFQLVEGIKMCSNKKILQEEQIGFQVVNSLFPTFRGDFQTNKKYLKNIDILVCFTSYNNITLNTN